MLSHRLCRRAVLAAAISLAGMPSGAFAHGMRTAYLEIEESSPGRAMVTWKMTMLDDAARLSFPPGCDLQSIDQGDSNLRAFELTCDRGLAGERVAVDGIGPVISEVVVRVRFPDGTAASHILGADSPSWLIPATSSAWAVAIQYVRLGLVHIATGPDHLLFLLAIALYLRRPRAVLIAETAFTISHSISFSLTSLGWIQVSSAAAEACIALSLSLLALDLGLVKEGNPDWWRGAALALVFGLVHGLGFAGGLQEVGMPAHAVAAALLGFGLGVELGQVAFLVCVLGALALLRSRHLQIARLGGSYAIGSAGSFWLVQRLWLLFNP